MAAQNRVGIDIGVSSIKIAVLSKNQDTAKLFSIGHIPSPQPGIISEAELDLEAVSASIKKLYEEVNPPTRDVAVALPESKIFTRVIYDLPYLSDDELAQAIRYAAEEFVPMPMKDVNLYYQVIFRSPKKEPNSRTVVFVVASPKNLIDKYLKVLQNANLRVVAIETEVIASARALVTYNSFSPTTLIIQLGASNTDYAVISEGLILLTRSIATGGNTLTRLIAQNFNFEGVQAEEYKKVYGVLEDQLEGKLYRTLKPVIDVIMTEAKRVILAHEMQNKQRPIKRVVLTGGGARMPGLVRYFAGYLGLEVAEADPWGSVDVDPTLKQKLAAEAPFYSVAVGLALKDV
jgi:type IV pilus assembly protein PilM